MSYPNLLSPLKLGSIDLTSRVVMAPMTRGRAGADHTATELMAEYYGQRAGAGLIISEGTHTSMQARGWFQGPDSYKPEDVAAWKLTTDAVHQAGGKIFCQLWHPGRASHSNFRTGTAGFEGERALPVAPSALKKPSDSGTMRHTEAAGEVPIETPRTLSPSECQQIADEYRHAADVAKKAGFDGVEITCANGFLLDTFLQACSNERSDEYGGSFENRFRIVDQVLQEVLTVFPAHAIGVRISPNGTHNGMGSKDFREAFLYYATRINALQIGYLHIMIGLGFGFHELGEALVLADFRRVYSGIIIANVGYEPETAEREIADGNADMVSFGRLFITNPDLVEKLRKHASLEPAGGDMSTWYTAKETPWTSEGYTTFQSKSA